MYSREWRGGSAGETTPCGTCPLPEHITQAGQEMYVRKESPKCFTSTDLRLKVGDAKKGYPLILILIKKQESKSTLQVFMWYYVYL